MFKILPIKIKEGTVEEVQIFDIFKNSLSLPAGITITITPSELLPNNSYDS